jgi:hypothetical protein
MNHIPIIQFAAPKGASLEPPLSSKPILTNSYKIYPYFITKVQQLSFVGEKMKIHMVIYESSSKCVHAFTFQACHTRPLSGSYFSSF